MSHVDNVFMKRTLKVSLFSYEIGLPNILPNCFGIP